MEIQIFTSLQCNLKCVYCYSPNRSKINNSGNLTSSLMELYEKQLFKNQKEIKLEFIGGEPLLHPEFIQNSIVTVEDFLKEKQINIPISKIKIITNFTLYHKNNKIHKLFDFIVNKKRYKLGLSVSLDGTEKVNDKQRIKHDGTGSFKDVRRSLKKINDSDLRDKIGIGVRVTTDGFKEDQIELINRLAGLVDSISIQPIDYLNFSDKGHFRKWHQLVDDLVVSILRHHKYYKGIPLFKGFFSGVKQRLVFYSVNFRQYLSNLRMYPCQGCFLPNRDFVSIGFNGVMTACNRVTSHQFDNPPFITTERIKETNNIHLKKNEICNDCEWKSICNDSCFMSKYEYGTSWETTLKNSCYFTKFNLLTSTTITFFVIDKNKRRIKNG